MLTSSLILALSLIGQLPEGMAVKYDKFYDRIALIMRLGEIPGFGEKEYVSVTLMYSHKGKNPTQLYKYLDSRFLIYRRGEGWKYLTYHDVIMMVGEYHITRKKQSYTSKTADGECVEQMAAYLTWEELTKTLAQDKDFEIKIGTAKPFSLDAQARAKLRAFVKYVEENQPADSSLVPQED